jgi:putative PIN family toxin of toxin-antitoxin system
MRVVFDRNIFVSAFVIPGSFAEKAILRIIDGIDTLVLSKDILDELLSILSVKFNREREEISRVAVLLPDLSEWVTPDTRLDVLQDNGDNRILECAIDGRADVIVTGDKSMLELREYGGVKIMNLKKYLELC